MITQLVNPNTPLYNELKSQILGPDFPWHWHEKAYNDDEVTEGRCNFGFLSHVILERPGHTYLTPKINSEYFEAAHDLFVQICEVNNIKPQVLYRINANFTAQFDALTICEYGPDHTDHDFPHKNMLVYLTPTRSGLTKVGDDNYSGSEDGIIMFEGIHAHMCPMSSRRIVLVYTFL